MMTYFATSVLINRIIPYGNNICMISPLGVPYCGPSGFGIQVEIPSADLNIQLITAGIGASAGALGMFLLAASVGTTVAYRLRNTFYGSIVVVSLCSLAIIGLWLLFLIELSLKALFTPPPSEIWPTALYFAVAPYLLALATVKYCEYWIHRST